MNLPTPIDLLDAVMKATVVLGLAGLVAHALRRASAARRHLVWTLGVAAALLLPSLRTLAPRWELPLLPAGLLARGAALLSPGGITGPTAPVVGAAPADRAGAAHLPGLPTARAARRDRHTPPASPPTLALPRVDLLVALGLLWLLGSLVVAVPLLLGAAREWWLGRRRQTLASPEWRDLTDEIAARLALSRPVRLLRGGPGSMPVAWGLLRPVVRLPEDAARWPEEKRRAVLTHELAHVKRHDCLTQALAHAACAAYWFHPLVWLAARRLRVERERACDDLVLRSGASGPDYADHLLQVARSLRNVGQPSWAAVAMARPSQLEGRLLAILDPSLDRRGPSKRGALLTTVGAGLLVVMLAGLEPWARPAQAALPIGFEPEVAEASPRALSRAEAAPAAPAAARPAQAHPPAARIEAGETAQEPASVAPPADRQSSRPVSSRVVAALAEALRDEDGEVRQQAVYSLGRLRAESSVPALAEALADTEPEVRQQAAFALGEIRAESAVPALTKALRDQEAEVRQQAVFALGQIRAKSAVESLIPALTDADEGVREQAAFALGEIRDGRAVAALGTALADRSAEVRQQAVFALGQLQAEAAVGALTGALKDPEAEVREQAAFALGEIRSGEAVPALVAALKDASADVRQQAAFALGQIGDASASDALSAALKDADAEVRRQAAFALGELAR